MSIFKINGKKTLQGDVKISGAKNEVLKLIPFSLLLEETIKINNSPRIKDVVKQLEIFKSISGKYSFDGSTLTLDSTAVSSYLIDQELSSELRASIVFTGPLLARFGRANICCPGGCAIGARSIESHLDAFRQAGVEIKKNGDGTFYLETKQREGVLDINLQEKSVTATENILLYLVKSSFEATISNIAIEPEVIDLIGVMNRSGGDIEIIGDNKLKVRGVSRLSISEVVAMPDRIEAGTFALALAVTGGRGTVSPYPAEHLEAFTEVLKKCGVKIEIENNVAKIEHSDNLKRFEITTAPYPGFPTDLQSPISLLAAIADGESVINETMFDNRLGYLRELSRMGVRVEILSQNVAKIIGPNSLSPAIMESPDLRSGITLLIAALMAEGVSTIKKAEIIDRGYESIENKLNQLGAEIVRSEDAI